MQTAPFTYFASAPATEIMTVALSMRGVDLADANSPATLAARYVR
jgi:hypothetical protein